jgi:hypothetical protein
LSRGRPAVPALVSGVIIVDEIFIGEQPGALEIAE